MKYLRLIFIKKPKILRLDMLISIQIMVKLINQVVKMKILGQLDALMKGLRYFQSLLKNIQIFKMSDSIII